MRLPWATSSAHSRAVRLPGAACVIQMALCQRRHKAVAVLGQGYGRPPLPAAIADTMSRRPSASGLRHADWQPQALYITRRTEHDWLCAS